jgi:hypothetical protein
VCLSGTFAEYPILGKLKFRISRGTILTVV